MVWDENHMLAAARIYPAMLFLEHILAASYTSINLLLSLNKDGPNSNELPITRGYVIIRVSLH